MCKEKRVCSKVATDPSHWERHALLRLPSDYEAAAIPHLMRAAELASKNDLDQSREELAQTRVERVLNFLLEHPRTTGQSRLRVQNIQSPKGDAGGATPDRSRVGSPLEREVFERDHYLCRYCGVRVVPGSVFKAYSAVVGLDTFWAGRGVERRHVTVLAFRAYADHVDPRSKRGSTDLKNLVTACWSCNYGKRSYTLKELRLDDPRDRPPPRESDWAGLTEYLKPLKEVAHRKAAVAPLL